jgi:hypothetical protein
MNEKPKIDIRRYRPAFIQEAAIVVVKVAEAEEEVRICLECPNQLSKYLRWYCSDACMLKAKENGTYRSD